MMSTMTLLALSAALLAAPSAIDHTTAAKAADCPLPCAIECATPVASCDLPCDEPCDLPCAADAKVAVAAK
jgi:hypothetical protein